jgi:hypothetical protein
MAGQTRKNSKATSESAVESQGNQLREIQNLLFGEQLGHVEAEIDSFRKEIDARLATLEKNFQSAIEQQAKQFNKELAAHSENLKNLKNTQQTDKANIDTALDKLNQLVGVHNSENNEANKALHNALQTETDKIRQMLAQQQQELQTSIDHSVELLTHTKTDRKELASLLQSLAGNLEAQ